MSENINRRVYTLDQIFDLLPKLSNQAISAKQAEIYRFEHYKTLTDEELAGLLAFGYSPKTEDRPDDVCTLTPNFSRARLIIITPDYRYNNHSLVNLLGGHIVDNFNDIYYSDTYDGIYISYGENEMSGEREYNAINSEHKYGECFATLKYKADERIPEIEEFASARNKFDAFIKVAPYCSMDQLNFMMSILRKISDLHIANSSSPTNQLNFSNNIPYEMECINLKTFEPEIKYFFSEKECKTYCKKLIIKLEYMLEEMSAALGENPGIPARS